MTEIDIAALEPILQDLGTAAPISLLPMTGGSNDAFRIALADGSPLVLKAYDDIRGKAPGREAYAAGLVQHLSIPVTRYFLLDESRDRLPFRFVITNWLPGVAVGSLRGEPDIGAIYRQMGAALRQLHTVDMPAYGQFSESGLIAPVETNLEAIRSLAHHAFGQFRHYGADPALADRLTAIVAAKLDLAAYGGGPVFAHDDLHPGNVLAERGADGRLRLTGIIDFGNARAADAAFDLAKTLFICEHDAPGSAAAILAGYGPVDHPDPEAALWLYTLLHRVVMWWWLRHVGVIGEGGVDPLIADLAEMAKSA